MGNKTQRMADIEGLSNNFYTPQQTDRIGQQEQMNMIDIQTNN